MNPLQTTRKSVHDARRHTPFGRDVLEGLGQARKQLPCKYFYDRRGSRLFDQICQLDEYYLTRTEIAIMQHFAPEMATAMGQGAALVELGSGSSVKTRLLLQQEPSPDVYIPVDISKRHLMAAAKRIRREFPELEVIPVAADFAVPFRLPAPRRSVRRRVVYFPGSTIGNFSTAEVQSLLEHIRQVAGPGGSLLIGIDLVKPREILEAAYDDAAGVTARFNLNLLRRINRELDGTFQLAAFRHRAHWNAEQARMEIYLESLADQQVSVLGQTFRFAPGELVHTENSHKYRVDTFVQMAQEAGFVRRHVWTDTREWFAVLLLDVDGSEGQ